MGVRSRSEAIAKAISSDQNFAAPKEPIQGQTLLSAQGLPQGNTPVVVDQSKQEDKPKKETVMSNYPVRQNSSESDLSPMSQAEKVKFVDSQFRVGDAISHLHQMMKEVTKDTINPTTVNAACNCVTRINETIDTAIRAARFLSER